ncbi:MAG: M23 family metallopeptidase [Myxococcales bacterium]|nr:M23 family metallopeptidase [Myxococcales bacterium]
MPELRFSSPFGPKSPPVYRVPYGYSNQACANRSRFCKRCRTGGRRGHKGVDLAAPIGTTVYPVYRSVVDNMRRTDGGKLGRFLVLRFPIGCDENPKIACLYATYAHLKKVLETVKKGQIVEVSTPIGQTGISGNAKRLKEEQHHLHLEISTYPGFLKERIDPSLFMSIRGNTPENNKGCRVLDGVMRKHNDTTPKKKTAKKHPDHVSVLSQKSH